ncbi:MAG: periplasmic heavy metal sensor [Pseudodesulfovibrio sp.]|uniref:Zinc resistance-associated protein n=1 Tax=Pseudodesulfovibrio aespoeensis (strain ATCC 700646 / DSM 10631 / Aspo-2) TaxID=643562 RepID=E6VXJ1_PSEA9|nr:MULTISPECIES: periplasmic heavy metal sensor [Pseudodesulfovibrio]MBU4193042.1 periplasmic heavy metal sensor [Pseudomonadota bacterium]ADU63807.1 zinc resistance-associated protein [Pseudodesulfovibrio aespoeensis Aspo-2]MBU4242937.1 periplasmic heavy metal sensor [Pseudomonadota bacterium]MBU4379211.1 periplasmic heavy metal sensor [Pseudomonadota bacterium]MBU4475607.1 periplasmic heavy metal sensor [Pseudomonadota bacterium]
MTKKNITTTVMAAALILALSSWAIAGPGSGRGGCGGQGWGQTPYAQLSPEKQAAAEAIVAKYDGQIDEARDALWTKHATMQALINGGKADEKKLGALVSEIRVLRDKMGELRASMNDELVKETGIMPRAGRCGRSFGPDCGSGYGCGQGMQDGPRYGQGFGGPGRS